MPDSIFGIKIEIDPYMPKGKALFMPSRQEILRRQNKATREEAFRPGAYGEFLEWLKENTIILNIEEADNA